MSAFEIISVEISRATSTVSRAGFGTALIAADLPAAVDTAFGSARVKSYASLSELVTDGAVSTDDIYKAVQAVFSQSPRPPSVKVGRRVTPTAQVSTITIASVENTVTYTATINGVDADYTSDGTATDTEIRDGLVTAIDALSEPVDAAPDTSTTLTVTSTVAGVPFTIAVSDDGAGSNLSVATGTPNVGLSEDLDAIAAEDADWYCLLSIERDDYVNELAAAWVSAHQLSAIAVLLTDDGDTDDATVTDDFASRMQDLNYDRVAVVYDTASGSFLDCAIAGRCLPEDPGAITWKFKTVTGQTALSMSSAQRAAVDAKSANHFTRVGGRDIFREGVMASGEFIDIMRGVDWLQARLAEDVFAILANADKVPFTDAGIAQVEGAVRGRLQRAVNQGIITDDFTVSVPAAGAVSTANKAARTLPDITFIATAQGAIHQTIITGTVAV